MISTINWLKIEIDKKESNDSEFEILVTFTNISGKLVNREYKNILSKAELLSFTLKNRTGDFIKSLDYISGTSAISHEKDKEFLPGEKQFYTMDCKVLPSGHLKVGRFHYPIKFNEEYDISFCYGGVESNVISWIPSKI